MNFDQTSETIHPPVVFVSSSFFSCRSCTEVSTLSKDSGPNNLNPECCIDYGSQCPPILQVALLFACCFCIPGCLCFGFFRVTSQKRAGVTAGLASSETENTVSNIHNNNQSEVNELRGVFCVFAVLLHTRVTSCHKKTTATTCHKSP